MQITLEGADELRRNLGRFAPELRKAFQVANKSISTTAVNRIRPAVRGLSSPGGSRAVGGITPRASQSDARIAFSGAKGKRPLKANVLGANTHVVFGRRMPVSKMRRRVWQPHLGNSWKPQDLYGAGPVIKDIHERFSMKEYEKAIRDALGNAFR